MSKQKDISLEKTELSSSQCELQINPKMCASCLQQITGAPNPTSNATQNGQPSTDSPSVLESEFLRCGYSRDGQPLSTTAEPWKFDLSPGTVNFTSGPVKGAELVWMVPDEYEDEHVLPLTAAERKEVPLWSGLVKYFPDALAAVAALSHQGSKQHHPNEPMHWDRAKSMDHEDCLLRHLWESGTTDTDGKLHSTKVAWRALAMLQLEIEGAKR